jgi:cytochrome c553
MRKLLLGLSIGLVAAPLSAADVEAGRAKVAQVCSACHGLVGVSVSDSIPNLAAQRAVYIETQLKALKDGTRKAPIMNAMAAQLSADDIANVAAYFSSLPGATGGNKAEMLAALTKSGVTFPDDYKATYTKYHAIDFPATKQVRYYYANKAAVEAAKAGKPLPNGAVLFAEVYSAKLDDAKNPVKNAEGKFEADKLIFYTAMARDAGWGKDIPDMLRNEDWNYAVFTPDKKHRAGVNQAECLACHKPLDKVSYTFTLKEIAAAK